MYFKLQIKEVYLGISAWIANIFQLNINHIRWCIILPQLLKESWSIKYIGSVFKVVFMTSNIQKNM